MYQVICSIKLGKVWRALVHTSLEGKSSLNVQIMHHMSGDEAICFKMNLAQNEALITTKKELHFRRFV